MDRSLHVIIKIPRSDIVHEYKEESLLLITIMQLNNIIIIEWKVEKFERPVIACLGLTKTKNCFFVKVN